MLTIAGYTDPYELWAAVEAFPPSRTCIEKTKTGAQCAMTVHGEQTHCKRHAKGEWIPAPIRKHTEYETEVWDGKEYIPMSLGVVRLMTNDKIPDGFVIHKIVTEDGAYPDNLQLVPATVKEQAKKSGHPKGEPIKWKQEGDVLKYSPTSVRLPSELLEYLDNEAARLGWSRNKCVEWYLTQGIQKGEHPQTLGEVLLTVPKSVGAQDLLPVRRLDAKG